MVVGRRNVFRRLEFRARNRASEKIQSPERSDSSPTHVEAKPHFPSLTFDVSTMVPKTLLSLFCLAFAALSAEAFAPAFGLSTRTVTSSSTTAVFMSDADTYGQDDATQERIKGLVEENPVVLFMKGNKVRHTKVAGCIRNIYTCLFDFRAGPGRTPLESTRGCYVVGGGGTVDAIELTLVFLITCALSK